ncbi:hypothetical protein MBLNU457_5093t1 [Dothideomycetes sp. NU457]
MWHFVDLTQDQKHERRILLDRYGAVAQASVLVPVILLQLYFALCWLHDRLKRKYDFDQKTTSDQSNVLFQTITTIRQWTWWAGEPVEILGYHVSTRGEMIAAISWTAWLILLCILQTGNDYLHLTKRFGIVAASQLPFHYLLTFKSPYSPLQYVTRASWETLNVLHQLLGRVTTILLFLHAAFYINFYIVSGILAKKLLERVVILGIIGLVAYTIVGTTALSWVRKRYYRVFIAIHIGLATALLPVLYWHVSHIRIYVLETLALYIVHSLLRSWNSNTRSATIHRIPGTNLLDISIGLTSNPSPSPLSRLRRSSSLKYHAGQHIYISTPTTVLSRTLSTNPFTIASLPQTDRSLRLVARIADGNTALLAQKASSSHETLLTIDGPYGLSTHNLHLLRYNRILLFAGGVGATFLVPLYRTLLADLSPSAGSSRRDRVRFVWSVRSEAETSWAFEGVSEAEKKGMNEKMDVWVTGSKGQREYKVRTSDESPDDPLPLINDEDEDDNDALLPLAAHMDAEGARRRPGSPLKSLAEAEVGVEMQSLLPPGTSDVPTKGQSGAVTMKKGRPDIGAYVRDTFAYGPNESVAVFVCGPKSLSRDVRKQVGRYVALGRDVWFWDEAFGL